MKLTVISPGCESTQFITEIDEAYFLADPRRKETLPRLFSREKFRALSSTLIEGELDNRRIFRLEGSEEEMKPYIDRVGTYDDSSPIMQYYLQQTCSQNISTVKIKEVKEEFTKDEWTLIAEILSKSRADADEYQNSLIEKILRKILA